MFEIVSDGPLIARTTYWDCELAANGLLYLSWNARTARLLVPDDQRGMLNEMATGREVIISRGPWQTIGGRDALELLFEDDSDSPFCLHIGVEQTHACSTNRW